MTVLTAASAIQPARAEYAGTYLRPLCPPAHVRARGGALVVTSGYDDGASKIVFYGPDLASSLTSGAPYEIIRSDAGNVARIRVDGHVARKGGPV